MELCGVHRRIKRKARVLRRLGNVERLAADQEVYNYQGSTVIIWGGISSTGRKELICLNDFLNAITYCDTILETIPNSWTIMHVPT